VKRNDNINDAVDCQQNWFALYDDGVAGMYAQTSNRAKMTPFKTRDRHTDNNLS
jgi:hypothetical protein